MFRKPNFKLSNKLTYPLIVFTVLMAVVVPVSAGLGIGTSNPDASAAVDITSTNKGVLLPRIADPASAISSPATGLTVYNTTAKCIQFWDGTAWKCAVGGSGSNSGGGGTSNTGGANALGGVNTTVPSVFASGALRQQWGPWDTINKNRIASWWPTVSQFWLDDNTFGFALYNQAPDIGAATPNTPTIRLYDSNFSLIREFEVSTLAFNTAAAGGSLYATGLSNGNILVAQNNGGTGCTCVTFAVVDRTGQVVIDKKILTASGSSVPSVDAWLPMPGGGFVAQYGLNTTIGLEFKFFDVNGNQIANRSIGQPVPVAGSTWSEVVAMPFGIAVIYPTDQNSPDVYAAYSYTGTLLIAPTPIYTGTASMFATNNYVHIDAVKGGNNQLFLFERTGSTYQQNSNSAIGATMKLTYDSTTGAITRTAPITLPATYQTQYFSTNGVRINGKRIAAKADSVFYLSNWDYTTALVGVGPIAVASDGTPLVGLVMNTKLYSYNFASAAFTTSVQIAPGPGYRVDWDFSFSGAFDYNQDNKRDMIFSPSGHRLLITERFNNNGRVIQMLYDTSDMSNIKPVTFQLRADNTPQDLGKRFRVYDLSNLIKKAVVTVTGGSNNDLTCDCDHIAEATGIPGVNTLTIQSSGAGVRNDIYSEALNSIRLATDTPGDRTVAIKVTNGAGVVSQVYSVTVTVQ